MGQAAQTMCRSVRGGGAGVRALATTSSQIPTRRVNQLSRQVMLSTSSHELSQHGSPTSPLISRSSTRAFSAAASSASKDSSSSASGSSSSSGESDRVVLLEKGGSSVPEGVALLTLNRPKALNALNDNLITTLQADLHALDRDDSVRVIVVTGSERAFAAGADIKEMNGKEFSEVRGINQLLFLRSKNSTC